MSTFQFFHALLFHTVCLLLRLCFSVQVRAYASKILRDVMMKLGDLTPCVAAYEGHGSPMERPDDPVFCLQVWFFPSFSNFFVVSHVCMCGCIPVGSCSCVWMHLCWFMFVCVDASLLVHVCVCGCISAGSCLCVWMHLCWFMFVCVDVSLLVRAFLLFSFPHSPSYH